MNEFGIDGLNGTEVIRFNMPAEVRDGMETLSYTDRLNTSFAPRDYQEDLSELSAPVLLLVGSDDEAFFPDEYEPIFHPMPGASVEIAPDATHFGVVTNNRHHEPLVQWLAEHE